MFLLMLVATSTSFAEPINNLVEFFSFTCSHCASANIKLEQYLKTHNIKFFDVNIDNNEQALPTTIMYYVAQDAGIGQQFKDKYFAAVANGMPAYTKETLNHVLASVKTPKLIQLLSSKVEQEHIKQKINYANSLIIKHQVQVTPSFLVNQVTLLEGEEVVNSLN